MSVIDRPRCRARQRGTAVGYRYYGCRCPQCRDAHRVHTKLHREHRLPPALVDAGRTHRRIEELVARGFTGTDIARHAGWDSRRSVHHLLQRNQIRPRTAELIARVYGELTESPAPSGIGRVGSCGSGHRSAPVRGASDHERDPARLRREVA